MKMIVGWKIRHTEKSKKKKLFDHLENTSLFFCYVKLRGRVIDNY